MTDSGQTKGRAQCFAEGHMLRLLLWILGDPQSFGSIPCLSFHIKQMWRSKQLLLRLVCVQRGEDYVCPSIGQSVNKCSQVSAKTGPAW